MRTIFTLGMLAAALVATGCATGSGSGRVEQPVTIHNVSRVAIVAVKGVAESANAQEQIARIFATKLSSKGYAPVGLRQSEDALASKNMAVPSFISPQQAMEMGQIVGADAIFSIDVSEFTQKVAIDARMMSTRDGSVIWQGSGDGNTQKTATTVASGVGGALVGALAGSAVAGSGHKGTGAVIGGVVGGAGGAAGGYFLSADQEKVVKKIADKMTASLPRK